MVPSIEDVNVWNVFSLLPANPALEGRATQCSNAHLFCEVFTLCVPELRAIDSGKHDYAFDRGHEILVPPIP